MTRDFYFLKDSLTNSFYTGEHTHMSDLRHAAVYHSEENANNHIKGLIWAWEHKLKYPIEEKYRKEFEEQNLPWPNDLVAERKNLKDWGVVVVKGTVKI